MTFGWGYGGPSVWRRQLRGLDLGGPSVEGAPRGARGPAGRRAGLGDRADAGGAGVPDGGEMRLTVAQLQPWGRV